MVDPARLDGKRPRFPSPLIIQKNRELLNSARTLRAGERANMTQMARYAPQVLHFPMAGQLVSSIAGLEQASTLDSPVTFVGVPMTYRVCVLDHLHRGGFYLVERVNEYEEFLRPGVEIETWETSTELIDKIRYYLDPDVERRRIAAAGRQ